ncbi:hypothetical protein TELCIR_25903, partial [Teladorsagia circumcincta]
MGKSVDRETTEAAILKSDTSTEEGSGEDELTTLEAHLSEHTKPSESGVFLSSFTADSSTESPTSSSSEGRVTTPGETVLQAFLNVSATPGEHTVIHTFKSSSSSPVTLLVNGSSDGKTPLRTTATTHSHTSSTNEPPGPSTDGKTPTQTTATTHSHTGSTKEPSEPSPQTTATTHSHNGSTKQPSPLPTERVVTWTVSSAGVSRPDSITEEPLLTSSEEAITVAGSEAAPETSSPAAESSVASTRGHRISSISISEPPVVQSSVTPSYPTVPGLIRELVVTPTTEDLGKAPALLTTPEGSRFSASEEPDKATTATP